MCIAVCGWRSAPDFPLVVIANRDEFHERPTAPLSRWSDGSGIVAGRDMRSGGTWLGVSEDAGRLALITNFREPGNHDPVAPSRGALVSDWLTGEWRRVEDRLDQLDRFNGFSLILIDRQKGWVVDNRSLAAPFGMPTGGFYGLSNSPFAAPWPKVDRLIGDMRGIMDIGPPDEDAFFAMLAKGGPAEEADAETAPIFIENPAYGTRCSTVITIGANGRGAIAERRFDSLGKVTGTTRIELSFRACSYWA
ncbi:NRDE family protein [Croceicoccus ponticola]|uniref:NRDE family protein n=1 Tax=Croceicoccus ponticola TaxID=2217664 RepID=A0A437GZX8_9SPHN|nr:NRDE family protein [Croceicoccus ponticola]RVQ68936.1 NRDE family protein [Croceicoccus ponticola]